MNVVQISMISTFHIIILIIIIITLLKIYSVNGEGTRNFFRPFEQKYHGRESRTIPTNQKNITLFTSGVILNKNFLPQSLQISSALNVYERKEKSWKLIPW